MNKHGTFYLILSIWSLMYPAHHTNAYKIQSEAGKRLTRSIVSNADNKSKTTNLNNLEYHFFNEPVKIESPESYKLGNNVEIGMENQEYALNLQNNGKEEGIRNFPKRYSTIIGTTMENSEHKSTIKKDDRESYNTLHNSNTIIHQRRDPSWKIKKNSKFTPTQKLRKTTKHESNQLVFKPHNNMEEKYSSIPCGPFVATEDDKLFEDDPHTDMKEITTRLQNYIGTGAHWSTDKKHRDLLHEEGYFTDLTYDGNHGTLKTHFTRTLVLCRTDLFVSPAKLLSPQVLSSLRFLAYNACISHSSNWWDHLIGTPPALLKLLFLARNHLQTGLLNDLLNKFLLTDYGPVWDVPMASLSDQMAGGNMGPRAVSGVFEFILRGKMSEFMLQLTDVLDKEIIQRKPYSGNGFRSDGCLQQHNYILEYPSETNGQTTKFLSQLYANSYGKEFLKNIALVLYVFHDTAYDLVKSKNAFCDAFFQCEQWLYRGTTVEPSSTGRKIDSGALVTRYAGLDAVNTPLSYMQKMFPPAERGDKEINYTFGSQNFTAQKFTAQEVVTEKSTAQKIVAAIHRYQNVVPDEEYALVGNRAFHRSDLMVHHRRGFMAALRMLSTRTMRPETWTTQNSKGYYLGDGFMTILVHGTELGRKNREVFQFYDWAKIPGTTTLNTLNVPQIVTNKPNLITLSNASPFAGGVSNGLIGTAAMTYDRPSVPVKAYKSWHFLGDFVVAMGSGINIETELDQNVRIDPTESIITTLNQVMRNGEVTVVNRDGTRNLQLAQNDLKNGTKVVKTLSPQPLFVHHDSVGYVFLQDDADVNLHVETVTLANEEPFDIFRLWLDHSAVPKDASYAYAMLPHITKENSENFARQPPVSVLARNNDQHVVCHKDLIKTISIVFFKDGCIDASECMPHPTVICVDKPCLVLVEPSNETMEPPSQKYKVTIADPSQIQSSIKLSVSSTKDILNWKTITMPLGEDAGLSTMLDVLV